MTTPKAPAADPIDPKLIRKLADILKETELTEIEVEQGELKIRVARQLTAAASVSYVPQAAAPVAAPAAAPVAPRRLIQRPPLPRPSPRTPSSRPWSAPSIWRRSRVLPPSSR